MNQTLEVPTLGKGRSAVLTGGTGAGQVSGRLTMSIPKMATGPSEGRPHVVAAKVAPKVTLLKQVMATD